MTSDDDYSSPHFVNPRDRTATNLGQAYAIITLRSRRRIFHGSRIGCLIFHNQMKSKKRRRQKKKKRKEKKGKKRKKEKEKYRGKRKRARNVEKKKSIPQRKKKAIHDATRFFNLVRRSVRICDRCSHRYVSARLSSFGFMLFNLSVAGLKESSLVLLFSLCFPFEIIFLYSYARLLLSFSKKMQK